MILPAILLLLSTICQRLQASEPALPYTPSLDLTSMDKTADPCVDFYQYSCGGWQKNNPIPADQTSWDVYSKLAQDNLVMLRDILEEASSPQQPSKAVAQPRDAVTQKVGDFYAACMDEAAVNRRGASAIAPELGAIAGAKSAKDLAPLIAHLRLATGGDAILFDSSAEQDPDNSEQQIASLDQGGLGLPDRDYYVNEDAKSKETRDRYVRHVQKIFELLGDSPAAAKNNSETVIRMETSLAQASQTKVERRDPYKLKHKMKKSELDALAPNFDWTSFFQTLNAPPFETVNVRSPDFFKEASRQLGTAPIQNWKDYLRYHIANSYAPYLSDDFVQEDFNFYRKYLRGAQEMKPRWKRCVQYTDDQLGEALGQTYVRKMFAPELKQKTLQMVQEIEAAMETRIRELDWMSPQTKEAALLKLRSVRNKIGYPDQWRDYSSVKILANDFVGNMRNATTFESHRWINKIGQPVDRGEWQMTPPTVNAYNDPQMNELNFPAGVLQPPLYDPKMDDAPNYGNTGGTIGHELTHSFDDEGRQYDAKGNLKDWWKKEDADQFIERTRCIQDQYAQYVAVDELHINSKLTTGEDVADLGGEIIAYLAWKNTTQGQNLKPVEGLTPNQRFFVGFAQWACGDARPEQKRVWALTDPHSPLKYRVNGVVVNMPEFAQAFSCKADQPMARPKEKICKVW